MRRGSLVLVLIVAAVLTGCAEDGGDAGTGAGAPATAAPGTVAPDTTASGGGSAGGGGGRGYGDDYGGGSGPTSSAGGAKGGAGAVRIDDFAFGPRTITARTGQRITWEHQDAGVTHTVTADGGAFRSGELEEGDEFSHLFRTAGTFAYHCAIHTDMRGTVKVGR